MPAGPVRSSLDVYKEWLAVRIQDKLVEIQAIEDKIHLMSAGLSQDSAQKVLDTLMDSLFPGQKQERIDRADRVEAEMRDLMTKPFEVTLEHGVPVVNMPR